MVSIRDHINTIDFDHRLKDAETLFQSAETKTSFFWGCRIVTARGFTGSIPLNELVTKVDQKTWDFCLNGDLATEDRLSGIRIITWLKEVESLGNNQYAPAQILIKTLIRPSLFLASVVIRVCFVFALIITLVFPFLKGPIGNLLCSAAGLLCFVDRPLRAIINTNLCAKRHLSDARFRMYEKTKFLETFGGTPEGLEELAGRRGERLVEAKKESIEALLLNPKKEGFFTRLTQFFCEKVTPKELLP